MAAQLSISSAASRSSGRYGADQPTTVTSSSLGATASLDEWEVSATLPYVSVGVGGAELTVGGVVIQPDGRRDRVSGFGDAFVTVGRTLPMGDGFPVEVAIQGQLKLPTGAPQLSTGKVDWGLDVELSSQFGSVSPFLSAGYRFYGDSAELDLENGWAISAGASITHGSLTFIGSYDWASSPIGLPAAEELFGVFSGPLARNWNWTMFGSTGLSEGAADLMFGIGLSRTFGSAPPLLKK